MACHSLFVPLGLLLLACNEVMCMSVAFIDKCKRSQVSFRFFIYHL